MPSFERLKDYPDLYRSKVSGILYFREYKPGVGEFYKTTKTREIATAMATKAAVLEQIDLRSLLGDLYKTSKVVGFFYAVLVDPKLAPNRIKLGFTRDVSKRLSNYRCICPHAEVLCEWPIAAHEEPLLIAALTKKQWALSREVFEVPSVANLVSEIPKAIQALRAKTRESEISGNEKRVPCK